MTESGTETKERVLGYDIQALRNNVERIDNNIEEFRQQIVFMEGEKNKLFQMIATLEAKANMS